MPPRRERSSHAVAAIDGQVYVFGGELVARQPRDGDVHCVTLNGGMLPQSSVPSWRPLRPLYPPLHPENGCRAVDATFPPKKRGSGQNAGSIM